MWANPRETAPVAETVSVSVPVPVWPLALVAETVMVLVPAAVGVPLIVAPENDNPVGKPVAAKLVGALVAVRVNENAWLTVALLEVGLVMTGTEAALLEMVTVTVAVPVPLALVAETPIWYTPTGVVCGKNTTPFAGLVNAPAGRFENPKLVGLLVAVTW